MDLNALWYTISSVGGVAAGALTTAWTFGRRYQEITDTQKAQGKVQKDQGDSLDKLWRAHENHKAEVDKSLVDIGGRMIKDLAEIKGALAVTDTRITAHLENCVTQKELAEPLQDISTRLGRIEGALNIPTE
jgi:hypothetical protein